MNHAFKLLSCALLALTATHSFADNSIKQKLEKEGFKFIKQIDAPANMTGWAGHMQQNPATVFIANDQKTYIVGDLYNVKGDNLSKTALDKHVKQSVLDEVWAGLEKSAWIQDGDVKAPRIIYVFSDPNCPYCQTFWEKARPAVKAGKVQLRHIQVAVIRPESKGQAATILGASNPEKVFEEYNLAKGKKKLKTMDPIPAAIEKKLDHNQELMTKYQFYATPSMIWRNAKGELQSTQGVPKNIDDLLK